MDKLKLLLTSRKFWAAFVGAAMIAVKAFSPNFPLTDSQVANIIYVLIAYILGTAIEDAGAKSAGSPPTIPPLATASGEPVGPAVTFVPGTNITNPQLSTASGEPVGPSIPYAPSVTPDALVTPPTTPEVANEPK